MMSTEELKIDLITQIATITDENRLKEIFQLLSSQVDNSTFITTAEEKKAILAAKKEVTDGEVFTNDAVQKEMNEWLNR